MNSKYWKNCFFFVLLIRDVKDVDKTSSTCSRKSVLRKERYVVIIVAITVELNSCSINRCWMMENYK